MVALGLPPRPRQLPHVAQRHHGLVGKKLQQLHVLAFGAPAALRLIHGDEADELAARAVGERHQQLIAGAPAVHAMGA